MKLAAFSLFRILVPVAAVILFAPGAALHAEGEARLTLASITSDVPAAIAQPQAVPANAEFAPAELSPLDQSFLTEAHRAADKNDWATSRALAQRSTHEIGRRTIHWRYLVDETSGASFAEITAFLEQHPHWPRHDVLLRRAEQTMPRDFTPGEVISWYAARPPVSKDGQIRLGQALIDSGNEADGQQLVVTAWIENGFSEAGELNFLELYAARLSAADQVARFEQLIARNALTDARRQVARLAGGERRVAEARLALRRTAAAALKKHAALPAVIRDDPRYGFDYARALRRTGKDEQAWEAMAQLPRETKVDPVMAWDERHTMARQALLAQRPELAYRLASQHELVRGGDFAEAEFLSGWIALRFLGLSERALGHFEEMAGAVTRPMSKARALYWVARAQEALQPRLATAYYAQAATYQATFYGQLSLAQLEPNAVLNLESETAGPRATRGLQEDERLHALHTLEGLGQEKMVHLFATHLANESDDPASLALITEIASRAGDRRNTLRIAKIAGQKNVVLLDHTAPILEVPGTAGVEKALVLGLTRQESEFNPTAVSPAGARGLMQLMPATAAETARLHDIKYNRASLNDPATNFRLGSAYLGDLLKRWSGSYVLSIASYNAGPGNVRKWVRLNGDPRSGEIDPVDWIEAIPFAETRNYVQRVLENTQVYRNRLAGADQKLRLLADLGHAVGGLATASNTRAAQ
jgi:soluble lytic murein transglycosylase